MIPFPAGRIRNIYFPFDIEMDTALSVATEMVAELDITDQDVTKIADMIDGEIASLVPKWKTGPGIEETPRFANSNYCDNCASNHTSNGSFTNFLSKMPSGKNMQILQCCGNGCASMHGRFEEITYQVDSPHGGNNPVLLPRQSKGHRYSNSWGHHESLECSSEGSGESHSLEENEKDENRVSSDGRKFVRSFSAAHSTAAIPRPLNDNEGDIDQKMRWVKAKYQKELRELRDQQVSFVGPGPMIQRSRRCAMIKECPNAEDIVAAGSLCKKSLLSRNTHHHRTASLPVDAIDI